MKLMKKTASLTALALVLSFGWSAAQPGIAQAGIIALASGQGADSDGAPGVGVLFGAVGLWIMIANANGGSVGGWCVGLGLLVLDADGSLNQPALEHAFANRYPFIDSADVVSSLSSTVKQKYNETKNKDGSVMVRLSKDEVRSILAPADLTEEQISKVASELN